MNRREFQRYSLSAAAGMVTGKNWFVDTYEDQVRKISKTDTHVHLFNLSTLTYPWLENIPKIKKNLSIDDFRMASRQANVGKIVFMESGAVPEQSLKEIDWVIQQAKLDDHFKGIIARGDVNKNGLIVPDIEKLTAHNLVKGIRGRLNNELIQSEGFVRGMKTLAKHDLSFDLLLSPPLLIPAAHAISRTPDTVYILDHLGNPNIQAGEIDLWKKGIMEIAKRPNVHCKISGIVNRVQQNWSAKTLKPWVHYVIEQFGFDRIVYGGDWPNSLRASDHYLDWARAFEKITKGFSKTELNKLYHMNADKIYRLA